MVLPDVHVGPLQQALHHRGHVRTCFSAVFFGDLQDDTTYDEVVLNDFLSVMVQDRNRWQCGIPQER